mmetsp:Transcript_1232/g.3274  ORF Transcript_1232/g.3274 Transcript_1232/m.3274 type:complete len:309 (-) Transcript_1232:23-949(-)
MHLWWGAFLVFLKIVKVVGEVRGESEGTCTAYNPMASKFLRIPAGRLGVSEPESYMFGNRPNPEPTPDTWTNWNWLKSRFHFSFAEYFNPANTNFGVLRVLNDDLVQPKRGFGKHPHRDVEVCTYIVQGYLTHQDSMGTVETLSRGAVQYMTAGTGVMHSEHNKHAEEPLRFIQIWITPRSRGLKPRYGSFVGDEEGRKSKWQHLVSDTESGAKSEIAINQDVNIHVAELHGQGTQLPFVVPAGRQAYIVAIEHAVTVAHAEGNAVMDQHDAAEVVGPNELLFTANGEKAHVMVIEMAHVQGSGRTDI